MPEVVRNRSTPQSALFKGTGMFKEQRIHRLHNVHPTTTINADVAWSTVGSTAWSGRRRRPATSAGLDRREPSVECTRTNVHPGKAMKSFLEKSDKIQVGISELEHFLLSPGDEAISIMSCAERAGRMGKQVCGKRIEPRH